jgi:glycosyltransferase involved in cell wall biosynthesis
LNILILTFKIGEGENLAKAFIKIGHQSKSMSIVGYGESKVKKIIRLIRSICYLIHEEFDIIILESMGGYEGLLCLMLSRMKKIPYIIYSKGYDVHNLKRDFNKHIIKIIMVFDRFLFKKSSGIVYISEWLKNMWKKSIVYNILDEKPFSIIYHAPAPIFFEKTRDVVEKVNKKIIFCHVSNFNLKQKVEGTFLILKSLKELLKKDDNFVMKIAGDGEYTEEIIKMIEQYGLSDNVEYVGHLYVNDLIRLYDDSDYMIYGSYSDGCPTTVMESQARGTPVINIGDSGAAELLWHPNSFNLGDSSEDQIAKYLYMILQNNGKTEAYNKKKDPFSWEKTAMKFDKFIKQLCKEKP